MSKLVPSSYQPLVHLKLYDGTSDPQSHIDAFKNAMLISGASDAMRCKAFPATLSDVARQCFSSLPPWSVGDFFELTEKFLNHFTTNRAYCKTAGSLYSLNQGDSKSLKDFIGRFNRETTHIRNLNQEVTLYAFTRALKHVPFVEPLDISPVKTLDELRT